MSEMYQQLDKSYFQELPELQCLVSTDKLVQKCLPNQADVDRILKIIQRKVLKRNPYTCNCEGNTGRILNQCIL